MRLHKKQHSDKAINSVRNYAALIAFVRVDIIAVVVSSSRTVAMPAALAPLCVENEQS